MNEAVFTLAIIVMVTGAVVLGRIAVLHKRLDAFSRLDGKLDALLEHAGIQFDPYRNVPASVVTALERGQKIEAIKNYRAATGAGLKEAKEFVEEVQRRRRMSV